MLLHVSAIISHPQKAYTSLHIYVLRGVKVEDVPYNVK
jgi:hypothetical protein